MTRLASRSLPSKKFYFLDYFFILLSSIEKSKYEEDVFDNFKILKQEHRLGESKYKKLAPVENPTTHMQQRYRYTFNRVVDECKEYKLIREERKRFLFLTKEGKGLLLKHRKEGFREFNLSIFGMMEDSHQAFRTLVEFLYKANSKGSGVLVFPHYSPLELNFKRRDVQTTADIRLYSENLVNRLQLDIQQYLKRDVNLSKKNTEILNKLKDEKLLPVNQDGKFNPKEYNKITKRIRDFWISHFLQGLYECPFPMSSFDVWGYRAKEIGIIQATESYPYIKGKLVYPTSVILDRVKSNDFLDIYNYRDGKRLFVHRPILEPEEDNKFVDKFVATLVKGYFSLRRHVRYNFINLVSLREIVCLKLKISMMTFEETLNIIYRLNLKGKLQIQISLEVDKLPEETKLVYMKREPVMVDGSYRNIIAIDVTRGGLN